MSTLVVIVHGMTACGVTSTPHLNQAHIQLSSRIDQKMEPSGGCGSFLLLKEAISLRIVLSIILSGAEMPSSYVLPNLYENVLNAAVPAPSRKHG